MHFLCPLINYHSYHFQERKGHDKLSDEGMIFYKATVHIMVLKKFKGGARVHITVLKLNRQVDGF